MWPVVGWRQKVARLRHKQEDEAAGWGNSGTTFKFFRACCIIGELKLPFLIHWIMPEGIVCARCSSSTHCLKWNHLKVVHSVSSNLQWTSRASSRRSLNVLILSDGWLPYSPAGTDLLHHNSCWEACLMWSGCRLKAFNYPYLPSPSLLWEFFLAFGFF